MSKHIRTLTLDSYDSTLTPEGSPERSRAFMYRPSSPAFILRKPLVDDDSLESDLGDDEPENDTCELDLEEMEIQAATAGALRSFRSSCDAAALVSLVALGLLFGIATTRYSRVGDPPAAASFGGGIAPAGDVGTLFVVDDGRGRGSPPPSSDDDDDADDEARYLEPLPPLDDLVDPETREIREDADVSWVLDFAVIGNAKSGTTFLKNYLGKHSDEIYADPHETCRMSNNGTDDIVEFFHDRLTEAGATGRAAYTPDGRRIKTGIKCPKETGTEWALPNYARYFPKTDFIVAVRHPVLWFQSFYNYRSYGGHPRRMPPPRELIGPCRDDGSPYLCPHRCGHIRTENVCTDRAKFHHQLARFGKTPATSERERALQGGNGMGIVPAGGSRIFLAELNQFIPEDASSERVAEDLSEFLGLERPLPSIQEVGGHKRSYPDEERRGGFIDICDDEHGEVREILLDIGREASEWIRDYFLRSPDVVVSSRDRFVELIERWGRDPCLERTSA